MPEVAPAIITINIALIIRDDTIWPRRALDEERVAMFMDLVEENPEAVPAIEVVRHADAYLLAEGFHRCEAYEELGIETIRALVLDAPDSMDPFDFAYEHALRTSTRSAKPLSRSERRAAVERLLYERSELSDRAIAELVGVDRRTVDRMKARRGNVPPDQDGEGAGEKYIGRLAADDVAIRLVRGIVKVYEARGPFEWDLPKHMGRHLAVAYRDAWDEDAVLWARRLAAWSASAVAQLEGTAAMTPAADERA